MEKQRLECAKKSLTRVVSVLSTITRENSERDFTAASHEFPSPASSPFLSMFRPGSGLWGRIYFISCECLRLGDVGRTSERPPAFHFID